MALRPADVLGRRYRTQLAMLRERVLARLGEMYDEGIDFDDLDASFSLLVPDAATLVRAGQEAGVALTTGYLSALVALEASRPLRAVTSNAVAEVADLQAGMEAIPGLMKGQISEGAARGQVLDYGRFLVDRFADAEVTRAVDTHTDAMTRQTQQFSGWEGIVSGNACDPCQSNAGFHELSEDMYRHGSCNCTKQYVVTPT